MLMKCSKLINTTLKKIWARLDCRKGNHLFGTYEKTSALNMHRSELNSTNTCFLREKLSVQGLRPCTYPKGIIPQPENKLLQGKIENVAPLKPQGVLP